MSFFDYYADALEIMDAGPETEGLGSLSANNGINANTTVGYNLPFYPIRTLVVSTLMQTANGYWCARLFFCAWCSAGNV